MSLYIFTRCDFFQHFFPFLSRWWRKRKKVFFFRFATSHSGQVAWCYAWPEEKHHTDVTRQFSHCKVRKFWFHTFDLARPMCNFSWFQGSQFNRKNWHRSIWKILYGGLRTPRHVIYLVEYHSHISSGMFPLCPSNQGQRWIWFGPVVWERSRGIT